MMKARIKAPMSERRANRLPPFWPMMTACVMRERAERRWDRNWASLELAMVDLYLEHTTTVLDLMVAAMKEVLPMNPAPSMKKRGRWRRLWRRAGVSKMRGDRRRRSVKRLSSGRLWSCPSLRLLVAVEVMLWAVLPPSSKFQLSSSSSSNSANSKCSLSNHNNKVWLICGEMRMLTRIRTIWISLALWPRLSLCNKASQIHLDLALGRCLWISQDLWEDSSLSMICMGTRLITILKVETGVLLDNHCNSLRLWSRSSSNNNSKLEVQQTFLTLHLMAVLDRRILCPSICRASRIWTRMLHLRTLLEMPPRLILLLIWLPTLLLVLQRVVAQVISRIVRMIWVYLVLAEV